MVEREEAYLFIEDNLQGYQLQLYSYATDNIMGTKWLPLYFEFFEEKYLLVTTLPGYQE